MLEALRTAYQQDGSGMLFNEAARSHRKHDIFSEGYFVWLAEQAKATQDTDERELLWKIVAKLSNPLLRQPAPFEF